MSALPTRRGARPVPSGSMLTTAARTSTTSGSGRPTNPPSTGPWRRSSPRRPSSICTPTRPSARPMAGPGEGRDAPPAARHQRPGSPRPPPRARPAVTLPARRPDRALEADHEPAAHPARGCRPRRSPSGNTHGGPGPRAQLYAVNPDAAHVAGARRHPGPDPGRGGRPDRAHRRRVRKTHPPPTPPGSGESRTAGPAAWSGLNRRACPTSAVRHLAIGTPARSTPPPDGSATPATSLGWHDPHLLERLADEVGIPIEVDNDVNLAAVAELAPRVSRAGSTTSSCSGGTRAWAPPS